MHSICYSLFLDKQYLFLKFLHKIMRWSFFPFPLKKKNTDWKRSQWGDDEVAEILRRGLGVCPTAPLSVPGCNHPSQAGVHVPQLPAEPGTAIPIQST